MTIVAGITCTHGVVLASDTLVSNHPSKFYESKIFDISKPPLLCYMAYSGFVGATKEVREELKEVVANCKKQKSLIQELRTKLKEIHRERFTDAPKSEKNYISLLLAINNARHPEVISFSSPTWPVPLS